MIWFPHGTVGVAGAGDGFVPTDIGGLELWYDLSDASTITDIAGEITDLNDKSGNARHLDQPTASERPNTATINTNDSMFHDLNDVMQELSLASSIGIGDVTLAVVFTVINTGLTDVLATIRDSSFNSLIRIQQTGDDVQCRHHSDVLTIANVLTANTTAWAIFRWQDGTQNGLMDTTETTSDTIATLSSGNIDDIILGGLAPTGDFNGHIHEYLLYSNYISDSDRNDLRDYLNAKWSL